MLTLRHLCPLVLALLTCGTLLAAEAPPSPAPEQQPDATADSNFRVVPGTSVGRVQLGILGADVLTLMGRAASSYNAVSGLYTEEFGHDNPVVITFERGAVVQLSVVSTLYKTADGLNPNSTDNAFAVAHPAAQSQDCSGGHILDDVTAGIALRSASGHTSLVVHRPGRAALDEAPALGTGPAVASQCPLQAPQPQLAASAYGDAYTFARLPRNVALESAQVANSVTLEIHSNTCSQGASTAYTFKVAAPAGTPTLQEALNQFNTLLGGVKFANADAASQLHATLNAWSKAPPTGDKRGFAQCASPGPATFKPTGSECKGSFDSFSMSEEGGELRLMLTHSVADVP